MNRLTRAAAALVVFAGPDLAEHVAIGLAGYRAELDRARRRPPPGLDELLAAIGRATATSRQSGLRPVVEGDDGLTFGGYLLSIGQTSSASGVSSRTIERLVAAGEVPVVRVRRRVFIDPAQLLDHLEEANRGQASAA